MFLACQFTDEQTGGHCPTLAAHFTGTKQKWFTFTNGTHIDSLDPATFNRWYDFLELYVAKRAPSAAGRDARPRRRRSTHASMGVPGVTLPDDPIQAQPTYAAALAAFEALPPVRILFDNGAGGAPGHAGRGLRAVVRRASRCRARRRTRGTSAPAARSRDRRRQRPFTWNPAPGRRPTSPATPAAGRAVDGDADLPLAEPAGGHGAVATCRAPLGRNTVVVGAGALQAWIKASVADVDLQVTVSEVRPDGKETFVQNGWLRASAAQARREEEHAARAGPEPARADAAPLPKGKFTQLTVPLYYEGHAYRAGSRIRVTISAPGGDQPVWAFARRVPKGTAKARRALRDALAAAPAGRAGRHRPDAAAALPGPARRALPLAPGAPTGRVTPRCGSWPHGSAGRARGLLDEVSDCLGVAEVDGVRAVDLARVRVHALCLEPLEVGRASPGPAWTRGTSSGWSSTPARR